MSAPTNAPSIHEQFLTAFRLGAFEKMLECWRTPEFGRWPDEPYYLDRALSGMVGFIAVMHSPRINLSPLSFDIISGQDGSLKIKSTVFGLRISEGGDRAVLGSETFLSAESVVQLKRLSPDLRIVAIEIYKTHYEKIMYGCIDTIAEGLNP